MHMPLWNSLCSGSAFLIRVHSFVVLVISETFPYAYAVVEFSVYSVSPSLLSIPSPHGLKLYIETWACESGISSVHFTMPDQR